ncbi:protein adenylyltransferase SelO [Chitinivibrio alkaliphilus]|uniref:Protein nucleotidyltransferase YdiU n=1 Tax=Chitinivibrio alkaliphilus ACht1 TaxID=1313304 RepID=U7D8A6_9BACT|nr:YdiU family protein [Chitinivibrio alkaliphilus]ERP39190.1 hypothetical protein CALK_0360 [Chitinivibrio alkaliphilus ACht1]
MTSEFRFHTTYTHQDPALFSFVTPAKMLHPKPLLFNTNLQKKYALPDESYLITMLRRGEYVEPPFAQAYAGHQFGNFTILGDGRAALLGEHIDPRGIRHDIQLKGSGPTPYSRGGDGKATTSAMLREYIYSECLAHLGVRSSRSLAVIETDTPVYRQKRETGAVLIRSMHSHIRIGTFQYRAATGTEQELRQFTDYVIDRLYPELTERKDSYLLFFEKVMHALMDMVIDWYRIGFIHGVMNTDNMSISGESFDYGPCAFMNAYDPQTVFSSIDRHGRYSFKNQRQILLWNLARFAETIAPLVGTHPTEGVHRLTKVLQSFNAKFTKKYFHMMQEKLGIPPEIDGRKEVEDILQWLEYSAADYTNTFLELRRPGTFHDSIYGTTEFQRIRRTIAKIGLQEERMDRANPTYIPRNYLVEEALDQYTHEGSLAKVHRLLQVVQTPWRKEPAYPAYQTPPDPRYDRRYTTFCNT